MSEVPAGKVAVITGGNSGIGLATARRFVSEGAKVAILGRDPTTLETAVSELGDAAIGVAGDVQSLQDLDRFYETVKRDFGSIDLLFVNAGVAKMRPLEAVDEKHFDELFAVNVKGAYFTVQKALPLMNDGGTIVLNTSIANQLGNPTMSVYAASKAALRSLVRTFSAELVERGIRVNAISPGPIETPIYGRLDLPPEAQEEMAAAFTEQVPLKRFGAAEEVANAVLFLSSSESSFVLGHELVVDGGMTQL
jgi:NAD(P)-dependent dehydrogenase (short-subunit alcohol dehydrogenase family)